MPNPPPRLSSASTSPVACRSWPSSPTTRCAAASKPAVSKICEPMWLCSPVSSQVRLADDPDGRGQRVAGGQREAELLVLVRGRDELVGVRLDADGRADEHRHRRAAGLDPGGGQRHQPVDLVEGVDARCARSRRRRPAAARPATCCCRAARSARPGSRRPAPGPARCRCRRRGAGRPRRSSGRPGRRGTPSTRSARRRPSKAVGEVGGPAAEVGLVEDEQRRAVLAGELGDRAAAEVQLAVDPLRRARPDVRVERAEVGRRRAGRGRLRDVAVQRPRRVRPHIRSGALHAEHGEAVAQHRRRSPRTATAGRWSAGWPPRRRAGSTRQES